MKRQLKLLLVCALTAMNANSQCSLTTLSSEETITCGDCVSLSAFGNGSGNVAFEEDFNSGSPQGWQFTQNVTIANNTCGVPSPDGSPFMWMGDASVNPRDMETVAFDLTLGGTICFEMRYSIQGDATPCEGPDEPDEGVYLQYSTNGGATWVTIQYFDPNGGNDPQLTSWNQYCAVLPPGALTTSTMIRWHQDDVSGEEYDHWGIDNVIITLNDPNFQITWLHDGYNYGLGSGGGVNPTPVCPSNTTTYTAQISNGVTSCTSTITVNVVDPVIIIDAGNDTTVCPGDCAPIAATAYELVSPASTPTFENAEISPVFSGNAQMNINVQGLNTTTVTSGSITSICLNSFNFSGTQLCTTFGGCNCNGTPIAFGSSCNLNISSFEITVTAPGGCEITLVPVGEASGTNYSNVCFVPAGGQLISLPTFPQPGNWQPSESFNALNGCQANGVWTMEVNAPGGLGFGAGFLSGWSITFDDPEITQPVNFSWSPVTDLSNSNTLSPTSCPTATTTYTLTATDTDGCVTVTDDVTITVGNCCALSIDNLTPVQPSCGSSDGSITVTVSGQIAGLQFSIDNGATWQASNVFSNLPAGTYTIQANDNNNCLETGSITLTSGNAPVINSITITDASCGATDGAIDIAASGGAGALQYSIDNGATFQSGGIFNSLGTGTYDIVVEDAGGCQTTGTATINALNGPVIDNIVVTDASCGATDGSITITASGGSGALQYSIDNGSTFQAGGNFTTLGTGTYDIVVEDGSGCQVTGTATINSLNGPVIDNIAVTDANCGATDGSITITASGGSGALQYSIDNGSTFQAGGNFTTLETGTYDIVVEDGSGCQTTGTATINSLNGPVIDNIAVTDANCGATDGSITITASGGSGALQYSIDNGSTFQAGGNFTTLGAGTYDIVVEDGSGCQVTGTATINANGSTPVNAGVDQTICAGDPVTLSGSGAGIVSFTWNNGVTNGVPFSPASTNTYTVTGTDANGCSSTDQVTVTVNTAPAISILPDITSGCAPLTVTFQNNSVGSTNCQWQFSNGQTINNCNDQTVTFTNPGCYDLNFTASDANGCAATSNYTDIICVSAPPVAAFTPNPMVVTLEDPTSTMVNQSVGGVSYAWTFGDGNTSTAYSPTHTYPDNSTGNYTITLTVTNADGCTDIATAILIVEEELIYYVPNSFTPDGDEFNQTFVPVFTSGFDPYDFNFQLFNRWGEVIFESLDHQSGWDGTYHGQLVQEGVYTWRIEFKTSKNDERSVIHGHVNVLR